MAKKSNDSEFRSNSSVSASEFIENYMIVYQGGGTNKDLAKRLGVKLQQIYPLRDRTNKVLKAENTRLPILIPVDRKYGSDIDVKMLADMIRLQPPILD
ncbi:MAG: hypothetical protein WCJ40_13865 [Planctomycetota bacterium]